MPKVCNRVLRYAPVLAVLVLSACATTRPSIPAPVAEPVGIVAIHAPQGASAVDWDGVVARAQAADVVILGEQHDDAAGHAVQQALVAAICAVQPRAAVAMEMLERDDQHRIDEYLNGHISLERFLDTTYAGKWSTRENWLAWYQPTVDAAKAHGCAVIGANAPRPYITAVRKEGFEVYDEWSALERGMVALPREDADIAAYAQRFRDLMSGHSGEGMPPLDDDTIASFFRAQCTWDATMADSVARALDRHGPVFLLVGQFHTDDNGGLLAELRVRAPQADILTISLAPESTEDAQRPGRADIVIQTTMPAVEEDGGEEVQPAE